MVTSTKPFAAAIFDIAKEEGKELLFLEQLGQIKDVLLANPDYLQALAHPKITREQKKEWMKQLFSGQVDEMVENCMQVMAGYSIVHEIESMFQDFLSLYQADRQIETIDVESAVELDESQLQALKAMLEKKLDKKVELRIHVKPELLAGLRVKADRFVLDNTIQSRLNSMKERLNS